MKINGFTIIELMVSILILSILATFSFSVYQGYYSKSLLATCLAEISHAKTAFEIAKNEGVEIVSENNLTQLNINSTKSCKSHSLQANKITGYVKNGKDISGTTINLIRDKITSDWTCSIENTPQAFKKSYTPNGCILK